MDKLTLNFIANINYSCLVRSTTEEFCKMAGFNEVWQSRLKLVVDELFMNAIQYGSTAGKSQVCLNFTYNNKEIEFSIEDDGSGDKAISADELKDIIAKNEANNDLTRTSGRGLSMITKVWTDSIKIESSDLGGIKISFVKKLQTEDPVESDNHISDQHNNVEVNRDLPSRSNNDNIYEVKLSGEIDQSNLAEKTNPVLKQIKIIPEGSMLLIDFKDVTYINSMFLVKLASWHASMQAKKGHVRLKNLQGQPQEVLDLVGMSKVLDIEPNG